MNHKKRKYCCYICGQELEISEKDICDNCELKYDEKLCFVLCQIYGLNFEEIWEKMMCGDASKIIKKYLKKNPDILFWVL